MTGVKNATARLCGGLALASALMMLGACTREDSARDGQQSSGAAQVLQAPPEDAVLVRVNGEAISQAMLKRLARARGHDLAVPEQRQQALDLAIESLLLAQNAIATGLAERPDIRADLDLVRLQTLAARDLSEARAAMQLDDAQLRAFYQDVVARTGQQELHLRNALYADEAMAKAAAEAARAAPDFAQWLAQAEAQGAQQARDLGWANPIQLPPQLAKAALELPDGGISGAPIQTRFGWHVIQRVASRDFSPPPFEQVRDGIRKQAEDKHLEERLANLRAKAQIEMIAP